MKTRTSFKKTLQGILISSSLIAIIFSTALLAHLLSADFASAQISTNRFDIRLSSNVYAPSETIIAYGKVMPNDVVIVRVFDPTGKVLRLDTFNARNDGTFTEQVFVWPAAPSKQYPLGAYSLEFRSSIVPSDTKTFDVFFVESSPGGHISSVPNTSDLGIKLDAPATVSTGTPFRIFVQITYQGALVNVNSDEELASLLGSSHVHSGNPADSTVINLSGEFTKLHEGLYYADVTLDRQGTFIIHAIAFHRGYLSHDSRVLVASSATLGSVQESVDRLNERLDATNASLDKTNASLNSTGITLTGSLAEAGAAIQQMRDASGQINSIILPILALISVIIALQISLFARIRASYR